MKKPQNQILQTFAPSTTLEKTSLGFQVTWQNHRGQTISRRWQTNKGSFFPVWHRHWPQGGTGCTALCMLIRWIRGQPVLPLSTWQYWSSQAINLYPPESIAILQDAGYPEEVCCVKCGSIIKGSLDWWDLDRVSGPAHYRECGKDPSHRGVKPKKEESL